MLLILFTVMFASSFGDTLPNTTKLTLEQYEDVKNDKVFLNILFQEVGREEDKILRNKAVLKNMESDLDLTIKNGLVEKELCIRQGVSALRSIDYVYNWVLEQIKAIKYDDVKLSTIQTLDRMRYLNKMFTDNTLKIEECKFKITAKNKDLKNEMINDRPSETKKDAIRVDVTIPEDYPAARVPFR